ncbi:hypothetical protein QUF58_07880 [Anaerolineales bacterium HSG24]|nr:hypothetical protein [Anaerolineales bacterium HSG24]
MKGIITKNKGVGKSRITDSFGGISGSEIKEIIMGSLAQVVMAESARLASFALLITTFAPKPQHFLIKTSNKN